jgi:prevent-host-death family protein
MKMATVSQAKNSLSALLARVRQGESIVITDRSRPVARLEPIAASDSLGPDEGRILRLERAGVIRRGRGGPLTEILKIDPPRPEPRGDIVAAVLDERRNGR